MPYEWIPSPQPGTTAELHLWPYRSLPKTGFVWFIGATAALLSLPLLIVVGTWILWGLLPFCGLALWGLWWGLQRSYRDGEVIEHLTISPDHCTLTRHNPRGPDQSWESNPYWVQVRMHPTGGPVEDYLTLKGNGREVEIGAFLAPDERKRLRLELLDAFAAVR